MKKVPCRECGEKHVPVHPVCRTLLGEILYVCRKCWARFSYGDFIKEQK